MTILQKATEKCFQKQRQRLGRAQLVKLRKHTAVAEKLTILIRIVRYSHHVSRIFQTKSIISTCRTYFLFLLKCFFRSLPFSVQVWFVHGKKTVVITAFNFVENLQKD